MARSASLIVGSIFLLLSLLPMGFVTALDTGAYDVRSAYDIRIETPLVEPIPISFWELPLSIFLLECLLFFSQITGGLTSALSSMKIFLSIGYQRILKKGIDRNEQRTRIHDFIRDNPGGSLSEIVRRIAVNRGTLVYHLEVLRLAGKIKTCTYRGHTYYFQAKTVMYETDRMVQIYLRNRTKRDIFRILIRFPSATRRDLADALGISGPSVSWHMRRLEEDGILAIEVVGRHVHYRLTPRIQETIRDSLDLEPHSTREIGESSAIVSADIPSESGLAPRLAR